MEVFLGSFAFDEQRSLFVGIERERFIALPDGTIVPRAKDALAELPEDGRFGFELPACQLEDRAGPCSLEELCGCLRTNSEDIRAALSRLGLRELWAPVGPEDMPLEVYPVERYLRLVSRMPREVLAAACRITGTHVHVGMPGPDAALRAYQRLVEAFDELVALGDLSDGARQALYRVVADPRPPCYGTWEDFFRDAVENGFAGDPRANWRGIRISIHGTVEVRVFDATSDESLVAEWARKAHDLCAEVI